MVLEQNLSLVKKVHRLLNWGHWFSFFNILLALVVTAVYWLSEPAPVSFLGWVYLSLNWFGHTAFLCFMFFILTIFPLCLIFPYQRHIRGLAAVLASLGLVVLIFDAYVYAQLGYHIGSASYDQTVELLRQQVVTNLRNFIAIVLVVGAVLFATQLLIGNFCWKKISYLNQSTFKKPILIFFIGSFMLSHLLHIYADANLKWDITKQDNVLPFSYPATAKSLLSRYQLVDLSQRAKRQAAFLTPDTPQAEYTALHCGPAPAESTLILVSEQLSPSQVTFFRQQGFRLHDQHYAPSKPQEALLNLLYGQFLLDEQSLQQLQQAPSWLQQLPASLVSIHTQSKALASELSWLMPMPAAPFSVVFDDEPELRFANYQHYQHIVLVPLHSKPQQVALAPVTILVRWPALTQQLKQHGSQHLDWLPSLLAAAGCNSSKPLLGDNLLAPSALPKLLLSQGDIISIRKDKMMLLRQDGSHSSWSAGTLVPLNERLDIPMLTDALKRLD
ncbi:DUF3413 domain-containing protein [Arsukibacterium sp.]|uniref:DUF3413 domain-containing protein n=1 Tax=Arsukibacterium sp. TaxID=1977258 RepID=UPI002FD9B171